MKKKIALALTCLLILTAMLTTPFYVQEPSKVAAQEVVNHWKIMLAQKYCNAWIEGVLTYDPGTGVHEPILGTEFFLTCTCELPEPQPLGEFVFWKVSTPPEMFPTDIEYTKYIDIDKDGDADIVEPITGFLKSPLPEEPHTWYQHVEEGLGPFGEWMVVVEVREQPYDPDRPFFEWQIMMKTHGGTPTSFSGYLTYFLEPLPGTDFNLKSSIADPDLQCQVVTTPYCTVPNDIHGYLDPPGMTIDEDIHQFPWTKRVEIEPGIDVELELTEVQMHRYVTMEGWLNSAGQLGPYPPWDIDGWQYGDGVPFATRAPHITPMVLTQDITFTQRDPITGIVELGIPAASYVGLDHMWYSYDVGTWFRSQILLETQGCGWLFTGIGKDPILGAVDYYTFNNQTGVYTFGADDPLYPENNNPADDVKLAGTVEGPDGPNAGGSGPPIGPCLQQLRGPDDIPGTADDPIGHGDPDGPNPPGSSIMFLPSTMRVSWWDANAVPEPIWKKLFESPWPQLLTTGTAYDIVNEPLSPLDPRNPRAEFPWHMNSTQKGEPWEFLAGLDHKEYAPVPWKHPKCNAYVTYACVWSVMKVFPTELGAVDILFEVKEKKVRDDCAIADIDCNELVDIVDIVICALAFGAQDEYVGPDGKPMTADDRKAADSNFDARGDVADARGLVDIVDIVRIAINFGWKLTPGCIIK